MDRAVSTRDMRRAIRRDEETSRLNTKLTPQVAGEFKADQSSQAVAEERKRLVQERKQALGEGMNKRGELSERSLRQPSSPTGELNRADLDIRRQAVRPGAKERGASSCIREAEQTEAGLWVRLAEDNPGIKGACSCQRSIFPVAPFWSASADCVWLRQAVSVLARAST